MNIKDLPLETLSKAQARALLINHLGLNQPAYDPSLQGLRQMFEDLGMIQLDPLAPLGTNADLVAMARAPGTPVGAIYDAIFPNHGFEHYAKERCLLPVSACSWYRARGAVKPRGDVRGRLEKLPPGAVAGALAELKERGPSTPKELRDLGSVEAFDYSGWRGTSRATSMALEVLFARGDVVVNGKGRGGKVYDLPERAFGERGKARPPEDGGEPFERWALKERAKVMGLMPRSGGPHWGMIRDAQKGHLPEKLVEEGTLQRVQIEGSRRIFLMPVGFLEQRPSDHREDMILLGPLEPLLWDRKLVQQIFDFEYLWEVYKPEAKRRWGWYVCPLLHRGELVGRLEGRVEEGVLSIKTLWEERRGSVDPVALDALLESHGQALGASDFERPKRSKWRVG